MACPNCGRETSASAGHCPSCNGLVANRAAAGLLTPPPRSVSPDDPTGAISIEGAVTTPFDAPTFLPTFLPASSAAPQSAAEGSTFISQHPSLADSATFISRSGDDAPTGDPGQTRPVLTPSTGPLEVGQGFGPR